MNLAQHILTNINESILFEKASIDWNNYLSKEEVKQFLSKDDKIESAENIIYSDEFKKRFNDLSNSLQAKYNNSWTKNELVQDLARFYENGHLITEYGIKDISNMNIPGPTDKRDFEGFDTTVAGNGPHDDHSDFIPENKYHDYSINKGRPYGETYGNDEEWWHYQDAYIAEITPQQYLELCYKYIFDRPLFNIEDIYTKDRLSKDTVHQYAEQMKNGEKFYMPYLDFRKEQQEGRHRALAAIENGYETIPCLILI